MSVENHEHQHRWWRARELYASSARETRLTVPSWRYLPRWEKDAWWLIAGPCRHA